MEKSLSTNSLKTLITSWNDFHSAVKKAADCKNDFPIEAAGFKGCLPAFFLADFMKLDELNAIHDAQYNDRPYRTENDTFIICATQKEADEYETDLQTVLGEEAEIHKFPWWGMIPYRSTAKGSAVFGERAGVLAKLCRKNPRGSKKRIFIVPQRSLLNPLPPPEYTRSLLTEIRKGQTINTEELAAKLVSFGYIRVPRVQMKGEFALRGEVLDVFLCGEKQAVRIVFDFDTIEQIKLFDTESQCSRENLSSVVLYPKKEVIWTDELVSKLEGILQKEDSDGIINDFAGWDQARKEGRVIHQDEENQAEEEQDSEQPKTETKAVHLALTPQAREACETLLTELSVSGESEGEELFYGVLFDRQYSLLDYVNEGECVFCMEYDRLLNAQKLLENEYDTSYRTARLSMPVLMRRYMLLNTEDVLKTHKRTVHFRSLDTLDSLGENAILFQSEAPMSFFGNINYFKEQLSTLQQAHWHIYIFADNGNQALRINEIIKEYTEPEDRSLESVKVLSEAISAGFSIPEARILVIQENEIFGRKHNTPKSVRKAKSKVIDTFVELNPGDYVVHVNYGIGLFKGIERVKSLGTERDYIKIEYAGEEFAFVPIEQVNLVQRYIGDESSHPRLDTIGSKSWSSRKAKVQQKVEEIAQRLIDLYSKRKASRGFPFPKDTEWNAAFEAAFPYEDTQDQAQATIDIKADMEKDVPMDRLVCGDVGYGKTEIALRAAFKAVMGGKQVAFLAPTTILAEQHYENCIERFRNFPVKIRQMSRFVSPADQKKVLAELAAGQVDILVGTHRILQKDVIYKDLGLLIIDEEQRFGVKDKERLKELKHNIDCLAMSATPIPRTLHMSLLKIRDMSLLTTPPQNRQSVETVIESYSEEKIARAIRAEVARGGQVFYLHNRVETLDETRRKLEKIVPEMIIDTAHGQMTSEQLDDIFRRFKLGGFHVLVATTIIENGIDIPNVNTIIIDRSDMYGISQLYQLRGRVGRSDRKAYAYLFYPENKALSEVAMKRLQVISDFTELGSGFKIAMKDMEIRGAGNLLGKDQSGEVYAVGFEMYLNLLNAAIERLSTENWHEQNEVLLELEYTGFIPDSYISDAQIKMEMYKKIAAIRSEEEIEAAAGEMFDRFGPIPDEVNSLLNLARIRIICNALNVISLKEKKGIVTAEFDQKSPVSIDRIMKLITTSAGRVKLDAAHPSSLFMETRSIDLKTKSDFIREKLEMLKNH